MLKRIRHVLSGTGILKDQACDQPAVKKAIEAGWRKGYNRVRLFLTSDYLAKHRDISIRRDVKSGPDGLNMYVSINGESRLNIDMNGQTPVEVPIPELGSLTDRNVIEIGVSDSDENQGAIWQPYSVDKAFWVALRH